MKHRAFLVVMIGLIATGPAYGQQALTPVSEDELSQVEPGVGDLGPLSISLREMQPDLRQPVGFDAVYRVPGREDLLMRASGGLYAVFPRSIYADTPSGEVPLVPYGTTFYIGAPDPMMLPPGDAAPAVTPQGQVLGDRSQARQESVPLDMRVNPFDGSDLRRRDVQAIDTPRLPPRRGGVAVIRKDVPRTIATDEKYRSARVGELVRKAAGASRDEASDG